MAKMGTILSPIEYRRKEIVIRKPLYEYLTIGVIGGIILVMVIIALAIMFTMPYSTDFENRDNYGIAEIVGYSMYPQMYDGEYVLYMTPEHPNFDINIGDVVVYYNEEAGVYVAHRVVNIYNEDGVEYVLTKGDNNYYYDKPITADDINAEVVDVIPNAFEKWCYEVWLNLFNWW